MIVLTRSDLISDVCDVVVVRAGVPHLEDLAPLFNAYRQFAEQPCDPDGCRRFLHARLSASQSVVFLAYADGVPAGFTQLYPTFSSVSLRDDLILNDLFVTPARRDRGVGRALLERAQEHCRALGAKGLGLETGVENHGAQRLYRRMGWEHDEVYQHFYWRCAPEPTSPTADEEPLRKPAAVAAEPGRIAVRPARSEDIPIILRFLHRKAEFDGCPERMLATARDLETNLFGAAPREHVALAEADGEAVGFATYYFTYASFAARPALWLDDLFVSDDRRRGGIGTALLRYLTRVAESRGCIRMEWTVSAGNERGIAFYERCGAQIKERTRLCRLEGTALREMANG
jgi:GNAT superfamily N-acetyltransferase